MVVHEAVQQRVPAQAHVQLALDGVGDLEVVVIVVGAVERLVQVVVGDGIERGVVHPAAVIAVDHLAHQPEIRLHGLGGGAQGAHEVKIQHVGGVQAQAVDVERLHPEAHRVQQVVPHGGILQVQLHQLVVAAPVFIGEAVVILVVAPEIHAAVPVPIGALLPAGLNVPEGEEIAARVVEHAVQDHPHARRVAAAHEFGQILVGAQAGVQLAIIRGIVAVARRLKQRADVKPRAAQRAQVVDPRDQVVQPMHRRAIIVSLRRARQAQGVYMIEYRFFIPSHVISP